MASAISADELTAAKLYMKIDGEDEDDLIAGLYLAAREYLANTGIPPVPGGALYRLAVWGLMLFWHDCPEQLGSGENLPAGTRLIINQLKPVTF